MDELLGRSSVAKFLVEVCGVVWPVGEGMGCGGGGGGGGGGACLGFRCFV